MIPLESFLLTQCGNWPGIFSRLHSMVPASIALTRFITLSEFLFPEILVLFQIEWKQSHAGVGRRKGLAGKLLNFPVVKKMMFVRLRRDLNPLALTMAA